MHGRRSPSSDSSVVLPARGRSSGARTSRRRPEGILAEPASVVASWGYRATGRPREYTTAEYAQALTPEHRQVLSRAIESRVLADRHAEYPFVPVVLASLNASDADALLDRLLRDIRPATFARLLAIRRQLPSAAVASSCKKTSARIPTSRGEQETVLLGWLTQCPEYRVTALRELRELSARAPLELRAGLLLVHAAIGEHAPSSLTADLLDEANHAGDLRTIALISEIPGFLAVTEQRTRLKERLLALATSTADTGQVPELLTKLSLSRDELLTLLRVPWLGMSTEEAILEEIATIDVGGGGRLEPECRGGRVADRAAFRFGASEHQIYLGRQAGS
jgi:hypothetical protein